MGTQERYLTIGDYARDELEIKKSRFITSVKPVATELEAKEFVALIQSEFKDATHNVFAYHIGLQGEVQRMSDDGEPQGTAGPPVLEVIKKEGLTNVAVVVTRYFGGTMLGAGGLIRAYSQAAKQGISAGGIVERGLFEQVRLTLDYPLLGGVQHFLAQEGYQIYEPEYGAQVQLSVFVATTALPDFEEQVVNLTNGQITIEPLGLAWR